MARAFKVRHGLAPSVDRLPPRMDEPLGAGGAGAAAGAPIDPVALQAALPVHYEMVAWDPVTGVARPAKLYELDIGWVAETQR